jgi:hypothetical protein
MMRRSVAIRDSIVRVGKQTGIKLRDYMILAYSFVFRLVKKETDHQLFTDSPRRYFVSVSFKGIALLMVTLVIVILTITRTLRMVGQEIKSN